MIRRILHVAGVVLVTVLWLAVSALWVRAQWRWDSVLWSTRSDPPLQTRVTIHPRSIAIERIWTPDDTTPDPDLCWRAYTALPVWADRQRSFWASGPTGIPAEWGDLTPSRTWSVEISSGSFWFLSDVQRPPQGGGVAWVQHVPHWFLFVMTGAMTGIVWRPILWRWHRRRHGWCVGCGYDLQGNSAAERCPECGETVGGRRAV